jgi:hypothetical protein
MAVKLTKTERRRRARQVRAALRQYDIWQDPDIIAAHPEVNAEERRWEWLLSASYDVTELIRLESEAVPGRWTAFVTRLSQERNKS